eukprot:Polyplicarium_translucidae@DN3316_c0_g1_i1.p1
MHFFVSPLSSVTLCFLSLLACFSRVDGGVLDDFLNPPATFSSALDPERSVIITYKQRKARKLTVIDLLDEIPELVAYGSAAPTKVLSELTSDTFDLFHRIVNRNSALRTLRRDLQDFSDSYSSVVKAAAALSPFQSVYLRNLDMEVLRSPDGMSRTDFMDILRNNEQVASIWADETIEGFSGETATVPTFSREAIDVAANVSHAPHPRSLGSANILPQDPYFFEQWPHTDSAHFGIRTPEAWQLWTGAELAERFVVAIIDSGVDYEHSDLKNQLWKNPGETNCFDGIDDDKNGYVDDCMGWDFVDEDNLPLDRHGHGTASAGIIAAEAGNLNGITSVCWGCELMVLRALNDKIQGTVSNFVRAVEYAVARGAKVSNNSYGGRTSRFGALEAAVEKARQHGMLFVAAAGNYQENNDNDQHPTYPASYDLDNVISVAAITEKGELAPFSSYGKDTVHLAAPGDRIFTTFAGGDYREMKGTSFAVPFVSASAALLWSREPSLSYRDVARRIVRNARKVEGVEDLTITGGSMDIFSALQASDFPAKGGTTPVPASPDAPPVPLKLSCATTDPCPWNADCVDTDLGPRCRCSRGWRSNGYNCVDEDECNEPLNPCEGTPGSTCLNTPGGYECVCRAGYQKLANGQCEDVNECLSDASACPSMAACINLPGAFECRCPHMSAWDSASKCLELNLPTSGPCRGNGNCGVNSLCQVTGWFFLPTPTHRAFRAGARQHNRSTIGHHKAPVVGRLCLLPFFQCVVVFL